MTDHDWFFLKNGFVSNHVCGGPTGEATTGKLNQMMTQFENLGEIGWFSRPTPDWKYPEEFFKMLSFLILILKNERA